VIYKKKATCSFAGRPVIKVTVEANREYVRADKIKIRNETRQVERYSALTEQNMGTAADLEKYEMACRRKDRPRQIYKFTPAKLEIDLDT